MDKMQVLGKARAEKLQAEVLETAQNRVEEEDHRHNKDIHHESSDNQIRNRTKDIPYII